MKESAAQGGEKSLFLSDMTLFRLSTFVNNKNNKYLSNSLFFQLMHTYYIK